MPCPLLVAALLAAAPAPMVLSVVSSPDASPSTARLQRGLAAVLEDDLRLVPGLQVRDGQSHEPSGKKRGATHLVFVLSTSILDLHHVIVRVVGVSDQAVLAIAKTQVKGGTWNLARVELLTQLARGLKAAVPPDLAVEPASTEQLEALGATLLLVDAKAPEAKASADALLARWPGFAPALKLQQHLR